LTSTPQGELLKTRLEHQAFPINIIQSRRSRVAEIYLFGVVARRAKKKHNLSYNATIDIDGV
jgi:hypothetical protein